MSKKQEKNLSAKERHDIATEYQFAQPQISLGPWTSYSLVHDPKHMVFVLARYKFIAKMLEGKNQVVEMGCGDGFGIPIVAQSVSKLHCVDWEKRNTDGCKRRLSHLDNVTYENMDINEEPLGFKADAIFSIDVIEHVEHEQDFMQNMCLSLKSDGVLITGCPNISASQYATERSAIQHINLKSHKSMKSLMDNYFRHNFLFGMNDEILHTGFGPMCHYVWCISVGLKRKGIPRK